MGAMPGNSDDLMEADDELYDRLPTPDPPWDVRREGRAWRSDEVRARYSLSPEKIELIEGKLFWTERDRLTMLALLLENVGADAAVRIGDPNVWREAVAALGSDSST